MSKQGISTGSAPNDGTGDTLLAGTIKINNNFNEKVQCLQAKIRGNQAINIKNIGLKCWIFKGFF